MHLATFAGLGRWEPVCGDIGSLSMEGADWPQLRESTGYLNGGGRLLNCALIGHETLPERPLCRRCERRWRFLVESVELVLRR
jgi:hypothetical protein